MRQKFYRRLARWRLVRRYRYLNEVNKIMEEYLTDRIMGGGSVEFVTKSRQELVTKQNEIKETEKMILFLRALNMKQNG